MRSGGVYEHKYLLGTSIARPLLAKKQVEVALATGCDALAHGCTGKGNDQVRFELTYKALAPQLPVIAPWREWDIVSREDAIEYAREAQRADRAIDHQDLQPRPQHLAHLARRRRAGRPGQRRAGRNLDAHQEPATTRPIKPGEVTIGFEKGTPVSVNGKSMKAFELLEALNQIGSKHGIGRIDLVENRFVGMKSRGCYETPGGTLLMFAVRELEALTLDRSTLHYKQKLALDYAEMVYNGLWFTPLREALDAFFDKVSRAGDRRSDAAPVQGQHRAGQPQIAVFALLARYRQLHHGRELRPEGRARLHQPDRAADQGARRAGAKSARQSGRPQDKPNETLGRAIRGSGLGSLRAILGIAPFRPALARRRRARARRRSRGRSSASAS